MEPTREGWDWRKMNEEAGLLASDDCRHCSGMGRVPIGINRIGAMEFASYEDCPKCGGTGKNSAVER